MSEPSTERFRFQVNYWLESPLEIFDFCAKLTERFKLPTFQHDYENENEWCISRAPEIVVHVSRAFEAGTYHKWDPNCPEGCNYSVLLRVPEAAHASLSREEIEAKILPGWVGALEDLAEGTIHRGGGRIAKG